MEGEGVEDAVEGAEEEARGDVAMTKGASTQTWNLSRGVGDLEEVGRGGMVARRATGETGTGDMVVVKEAVTKTGMVKEDTREMAEVKIGAVAQAGMLEEKTGKWEEIQVKTGGEMKKGQV